MSERGSETEKPRQRKRGRKGRRAKSEVAEQSRTQPADEHEVGESTSGEPAPEGSAAKEPAKEEPEAGDLEASDDERHDAGGGSPEALESTADPDPATGEPEPSITEVVEPVDAGGQTRELPRDLQGLVARLLGFWLERGCTLLPPVDFPVPAATLHPDVFFRLLGNGPTSAVFLQPVRRPMDRRDGRHPFRFSRPLQLEVIWSGPGAELQPTFLESLRDVGLDLGTHDLSFADGLYESRTLAARGMSWHATVDGLGVARLSFVHRALGRRVDPPVCEVVYGLERLGMVLWGVDRADDLEWRYGGESRGDLFGGLEKEYSAYLTRAADLEAWRLRLEHFELEARRCLEEGLLGTAYELAIRCLEGIDLLTVRGELDLRARDERLEEVRDLVLAVAEADTAGRAESAGSEAAESGPIEPGTVEDA